MTTIIITADGNLRHIYDDELNEMDARLGNRSVSRASMVEPNADGNWLADLSPVGGPVLGPFAKRGEALACEVNWLERNNIPEVRNESELHVHGDRGRST